MATTMIDLTDTHGAEVGAPAVEFEQTAGFEIEFSDGATLRFHTEEDVRDAILRGDVPRGAHIHRLGAADGARPTTVEVWAKSSPRVKALYASVWAVTGKGALVGLCVVGALKALDTLIGIAAVNPGAAFIWLLLGAGLISPKWKLQLMGAALFLSFKSGVSWSLLLGAWAGVMAFAAVFGVSAGMAVGTVVGFLRARGLHKARDAEREGLKPLVWGFVTPLAVFAVAAVSYVQVVLPAALKAVSQG